MAISNQDLRKAGLKVTLPRIKILELLENAIPHHLSAEDIYKKLLEQGEDVGLATVYRVLTQFEMAGIVQRHNFDTTHSVFEIKQETSHDHLVCQRSNQIIEFRNEDIEQKIHEIAEQHDFVLTGHSLILFGYCRNKS
ncbi:MULTISPECIES: ferric iron uptake transcriptional regulator [unclassified Acinetobacter]|uniref:ferric iron uptake transcriptional regulator n=1 Tax=unclassified Acinetobacter TaxID=196816 RepID=UPI002447F72E|nr:MULTISPECIES: ferric iron uptake transcriptional regulator [unclassified Acinetobacter]MDH0033055.1 ferric iron uptake transcriptional regulator [Acinetobacter sp. GD04021]MDH0888417.1 ferric iron uptake transcriptional regulator [Acinetobacter sp. GD03873]MDH1084825.1 ferric iron uptake transcriptional regulator [Acinetobacter sp. GD03983]MDH2191715.1 ferric iron uptake transcriptional regulator [Acinetobacter sp. GD03645]MDH2205332.1 ferric iron uptake transcriptional regulator [Acinetoba